MNTGDYGAHGYVEKGIECNFKWVLIVCMCAILKAFDMLVDYIKKVLCQSQSEELIDGVFNNHLRR